MSLTKTKPQKVGAAEKTVCYSKAVTEILSAQQKLGKALEKMSEQMIRLQCQQQQAVQADNNSSEQVNASDSSDVEMVILQAPWKRGRGRVQDRGHDRAHSRGRSHGRDRGHSRGRSHGRDRSHSRGRSHGRSRSRSSSSSSSSDEEFSEHGMFRRHKFMHPHGPHGGFGRHHMHHKHGKHGKYFMKALHAPWGHGRRLGRRVYY